MAERRQTSENNTGSTDLGRDALASAEYRNRFCLVEGGVRYRQGLKDLLADHISLDARLRETSIPMQLKEESNTILSDVSCFWLVECLA